jgi:hypothetical protein
MAVELTDANFQEKVIASDKLTIVDFCRMVRTRRNWSCY